MPPIKENIVTPSWRVFFGTLVIAAVLLGLQSGPLLMAASESLSQSAFAPLNGAWAYSLVISVAGIGFLFAGNTLRAYRVRRKDRWVFYGAGVWMLVYAVAFTNVVSLRRIGYGLFGVLFALYAVVAYLVLGQATDEP
jgi:hypothetical protein